MSGRSSLTCVKLSQLESDLARANTLPQAELQFCEQNVFPNSSFSPPFDCCRWGNPEFGVYVDQLQQQADEALAQSPGQLDAAKAIVQQVVQLELDFWNMAYAGNISQ